MKIRPAGTELFYADGQTHRQTDRRENGLTDRHYEVNSGFFRNVAYAAINKGGTREPG